MKIATLSIFGYPDKINTGKYLFTHEQAKAMSGLCEVHAFDLGADCNLFNNVAEEIYDTIRIFRFPKLLRKKIDILRKLFRLLSFRRKLRTMLSGYDYLLLSFIDPRYVIFLFPFRKFNIAVTAHGFDALINQDGILTRIVKKYLLSHVNLILPVSDFTSELVRTSISETDGQKINLVYNGINKNKLVPAREVDKWQIRKTLGIENRLMILTICNLVERKGVDIAIRADKILKQKGYEFMHIIAGNGLEKSNLEKLVNELGLTDTVHFVNQLSDTEIGFYYKAADIFVVISRNLIKKKQVEGFGIVFAEAGFLGIPVIGGDSGGVSSVVKHEHTGFLINPDNEEPEKLTAYYIEKLFKDDQLWCTMSNNSQEYVNANFDWDLNAKKILELMIKTKR